MNPLRYAYALVLVSERAAAPARAPPVPRRRKGIRRRSETEYSKSGSPPRRRGPPKAESAVRGKRGSCEVTTNLCPSLDVISQPVGEMTVCTSNHTTHWHSPARYNLQDSTPWRMAMPILGQCKLTQISRSCSLPIAESSTALLWISRHERWARQDPPNTG